MREYKTYKDIKTAEDFFILMINFEWEMGEDFIDQNESFIGLFPFAHFLRGRGYLSIDKFNTLLNYNNKLEEEDGVIFFPSLQDFLGGYNTPEDKEPKWQLFPLGECDEEAHQKGFQLMAKYCEGVEYMKKKMFDICNGEGWGDIEESDFENKEDYDHYYDNLKAIDDEREKEILELWKKIKFVTIESINNRLLKEWEND